MCVHHMAFVSVIEKLTQTFEKNFTTIFKIIVIFVVLWELLAKLFFLTGKIHKQTLFGY